MTGRAVFALLQHMRTKAEQLTKSKSKRNISEITASYNNCLFRMSVEDWMLRLLSEQQVGIIDSQSVWGFGEFGVLYSSSGNMCSIVK